GIAPDERAFDEIAVARQETAIGGDRGAGDEQLVLEGQIALIAVADADMTLAANLVLLIERQVLEAMHDPDRIARPVELRAARLLLLGRFDVLAAGPMAALAADRQFPGWRARLSRRRNRAHHLPARASCALLDPECGAVAAHAFRLGEARDRQFIRLARYP